MDNSITLYEKTGDISWDLSEPLLEILGDNWTIGDACEGVQIFGGTGSGKTSGSGQTLAKTYIHNGFGGLVLTVKEGDSLMWKDYCKSLGKSKSLMIVNQSREFQFNFMDYLVKNGYSTVNMTHIFLSALQKHNAGDYWQVAMEQLIKNTINLLILGTGTVEIKDMYELINDAPSDKEERNLIFGKKGVLLPDNDQNQNIYFREVHVSAKNKIDQYKKELLADPKRFNLDDAIAEFENLTAKYWHTEFPKMDSDPRSSIISMFTSLADNLLRGEMRSILACDPKLSNYKPEDTFEKGKIIVLDLNIKRFRETGKMAQLIFKTIFQMAVERNRENVENKDAMRPIFLWIDEAQFFLTKDDVLFQTTARSCKVCSVYLTQNYSNYLAFVGSNREKDTVNSMLAVLQTKFLHCQSDPFTNNDFVNLLIGKDYKDRESSSSTIGGVVGTSNNSNITKNSSKSLDHKILPWKFDQLAKGGKFNNYKVEAYVYQSGRTWTDSKNTFGLIEFDQEI
jgi:hypothetical protein